MIQEDSRIKELESRIVELESQLTSQSQQITELLSKIVLLENELSDYRSKKDSSNSSIAPSRDPHRIRRTESIRAKSGLKPGGQPGHEGSCLEMSAEPAEIVVHVPDYCPCCGRALCDVPSDFIGKRQVIDIPPVKPVIVEHRVYGRRCPCGHLTVGDYPCEARSHVCYGHNLQALTAYFHSRQYIAFDRMRELYGQLFGLSISSGTLVTMVESFAGRCKGIYGDIRRRIAESSVVGADETGVCINGINGWAWAFQTPEVTLIHSDRSRGKKVIDKLFPEGFSETILIHDCWPSYFGVPAGGHQICTAHLLRDLKYLGKRYPQQQWSAEFTALLDRALKLKKTLAAGDYSSPVAERTALEGQFDELLDRPVNAEDKKLIVFKERIIKYRKYLLTFLYHPEVPPDNNASERAIRTYKVKQKVSGLFRSEDGAKAFAVIRSVIDTTIKNTKNVWEALAIIPTIDIDSS